MLEEEEGCRPRSFGAAPLPPDKPGEIKVKANGKQETDKYVRRKK